MSEHTPGPWTWDEVPLPGLGEDRWCEVLNAADGTAVLRHESSGGPTPWLIRPADARLIAAAPELLEAAVALVRKMDEWAAAGLDLPAERFALEKVISKAEGSKP